MRGIGRAGNTMILIALGMTMLIGSVAFVTDAGMGYAKKRHLSNSLDAAALAGGMELPADGDAARTKANEYLTLNDVDPDDVTITVAEDNRSIELVGNEQMDLYFARIFGMDTADVAARAKVIVGPLASVGSGIRPYSIEQGTILDFPDCYGQSIVIKEGTEDPEDVLSGNFKTVALGGTGKSVLLDNALNGFDGEVAIGDVIDTEPGNAVSVSNQVANWINSTAYNWQEEYADGTPYMDERTWLIPLVEVYDVNGRDEITVVGFGMIYVEDIEVVGGKTEITAKFMQSYTSLDGIVDLTLADTGVLGMNLVE